MLGQTLKGRLGLYTVTKQLQDSVWVARYGLIVTRLTGYAIDTEFKKDMRQ